MLAKIHALPPLSTPVIVGSASALASLLKFDLLIYLVIPMAILIWWLLFRTRWGLGVRAVGENADPLSPPAAIRGPIRYQALFLGGLLAGMGAAHCYRLYNELE